MTSWVAIVGGVVAVAVFMFVQLKVVKPKERLTWSLPGAKAIPQGTTSGDSGASVAAQTSPLVGKWPAVVFSRERGITFEKIPEKVGMTHYMDPSIPERGAHYMVIKKDQDGKGVYEAYDPRHSPALSNQSPQKAYRAIVWDTMKRVYAYHFGVWDKINTLLAGVGIVGMILVAMMLIDQLGKN